MLLTPSDDSTMNWNGARTVASSDGTSLFGLEDLSSHLMSWRMAFTRKIYLCARIMLPMLLKDTRIGDLLSLVMMVATRTSKHTMSSRRKSHLASIIHLDKRKVRSVSCCCTVAVSDVCMNAKSASGDLSTSTAFPGLPRRNTLKVSARHENAQELILTGAVPYRLG